MSVFLPQFVEDAVEGLRNAYSRTQRLTNKDVATAVNTAHDRLKERVKKSPFTEAFSYLTRAEQFTLRTRVEALGERKKEFELYTPKIEGVAVLRTIIMASDPEAGKTEARPEEILATLAFMFGKVDPPGPGGLEGAMGKAKKQFEGMLKGLGLDRDEGDEKPKTKKKKTEPPSAATEECVARAKTREEQLAPPPKQGFWSKLF